MTVSIQQARDLHFAECLIRENMAAYYAKLPIRWELALFKRNRGGKRNHDRN